MEASEAWQSSGDVWALDTDEYRIQIYTDLYDAEVWVDIQLVNHYAEYSYQWLGIRDHDYCVDAEMAAEEMLGIARAEAAWKTASPRFYERIVPTQWPEWFVYVKLNEDGEALCESRLIEQLIGGSP